MRGILLDIEGTTTPISFVHDVLFPFARNRLASWFSEHRHDSEVAADMELLAAEHDADRRHGLTPPAHPIPYCLWLMDQDRKSTALKSIQGKIWAAGYQNGSLKAEVFPDVPPALRAWFNKKADVRIFSSGSVLAQRLLFANTAEGDLTVYLAGYFDTNTGPKTASESYVRIASLMACEPKDVVFVSDVVMELEAARTAGMAALLCVRPGNAPQPDHAFDIIRSFEEIGESR
jgi:enolase-phosphatase E1